MSIIMKRPTIHSLKFVTSGLLAVHVAFAVPVYADDDEKGKQQQQEHPGQQKPGAPAAAAPPAQRQVPPAAPPAAPPARGPVVGQQQNNNQAQNGQNRGPGRAGGPGPVPGPVQPHPIQPQPVQPQPVQPPPANPNPPPQPPPPPQEVDNRPMFDVDQARQSGGQLGQRMGQRLIHTDGSVKNIQYNAVMGFASQNNYYTVSAVQSRNDAYYSNARSAALNSGTSAGVSDGTAAGIASAHRDADSLMTQQEQSTPDGVQPNFQIPAVVVAPPTSFSASNLVMPSLQSIMSNSTNAFNINGLRQMLTQEDHNLQGTWMIGDGDEQNAFDVMSLYNMSLDPQSAMTSLSTMSEDQFQSEAHEAFGEMNGGDGDGNGRGDGQDHRDFRGDDGNDNVLAQLNQTTQLNGQTVDYYKNADDARHAFHDEFVEQFANVLRNQWSYYVSYSQGDLQQRVQADAQSLLNQQSIGPEFESEVGNYDGYAYSYSDAATRAYVAKYPVEFKSYFAAQTTDIEHNPHIMNVSLSNAQPQNSLTIGDTATVAIAARNLGGVQGAISMTVAAPTANSLYSIQGSTSDTKSIGAYIKDSGPQILDFKVLVTNQSAPDQDISVPVALTYHTGTQMANETQNISVHLSFEAMLNKIGNPSADPAITARLVSSLGAYLAQEWNNDGKNLGDKLKNNATSTLIGRVTAAYSAMGANQAQFKNLAGNAIKQAYPNKQPGCGFLIFACGAKNGWSAVDGALKGAGLPGLK